MLVSTLGYSAAVPNNRVAHVQLHRTRGARFHVSGIPLTASRSSISRIYAAFECCGFPRIAGAFTLHIRPTDQIKDITTLDLPIALALLGHAGIIPADALRRIFSAGEMGLDGQLQSQEGTKPPIKLEVPFEIPIDALLLPDGFGQKIAPWGPPGRTLRTNHLIEAVGYLQGHKTLPVIKQKKEWNHRERWNPCAETHWKSLRLSPIQMKALIIAAVGRLPLLIIGSSGTGKSLMGRALHQLLPPLREQHFAELEKPYRTKGIPFPITDRPPIRKPHHQCTSAGLLGTITQSGAWSPGELSLAHHGLLCLDELCEFSRDCIEALRGPLEDDGFLLSRAGQSRIESTANWIVATSNPCPCGRFNDGPTSCPCTKGQVQRYLQRLSGPIIERFALHLETTAVAPSDSSPTPDLIAIRDRITSTRTWLNTQPPVYSTPKANAIIQNHVSQFRSSARSLGHLSKIAQIHAAIEQHNQRKTIEIGVADVEFASQLRIFDRPRWWEKPEMQ